MAQPLNFKQNIVTPSFGTIAVTETGPGVETPGYCQLSLRGRASALCRDAATKGVF